jgi:two-component system nitrate/nitrite response regulator NarL
MSSLRVLIADSQSDVRYALRVLLQLVRELNADVLGEVSDAESLHHHIVALNPDLLLLDWHLPGLPSQSRLSVLRLLKPGLKVIVLSGRPELRLEAMNAGADAFISKIDSVEPLIAAIRQVSHAPC